MTLAIYLQMYLHSPSLPQPRAVVSWDSTVHDNSSLNKTTGSNDRVYAILKVTVILSHPPGIELVLRKRICLRVYKKLGFGAALMRAIAGKVSGRVGEGLQL